MRRIITLFIIATIVIMGLSDCIYKQNVYAEAQPSASDYCNEGNNLIEKRLFKEAEEKFDMAIQLDPNSKDAYYGKIHALLGLNKYADTLLYYNKIIEIDPKDIRAYKGKATILEISGGGYAVVECYTKIIELDPFDTESLRKTAKLLQRYGKNREAIICYDRIIEINPKDIEAYKGKASALEYRNGSEAIECYTKIIELDPSDTESLKKKARLLKSYGRVGEAITCYEKVIEINPKDTVAYRNKASILEELKKYDEALQVIRKASEISPDEFYVWHDMISILEKMEKYEDVLACYDQMIRIQPDSITAYSSKASVLSRLKRYDEALKIYDQLIASKPDNYTIFYEYRGSTLHELGRYDEALESYNKHLESYPNNYHVKYKKGRALAKLSRLGEMVDYLMDVLKEDHFMRYELRYDPAFENIRETGEFITLSGIILKVNGTEVVLDEWPRIINGSVMVPLEHAFNALGAQVDRDNETNTITGHKNDTRIILKVGDRTATVNGKPVKLDVPATSINGSVFVPVRFVAESFGARVNWNKNTRTAYINTPSTKKRYSDEQLEWALGASAITLRMDCWPLNLRGGKLADETGVLFGKNYLDGSWGIKSREDALRVVNNLKKSGHLYLDAGGEQKKLVGWELCRLVRVAGECYVAGYLTDEESWGYIMDAAQTLQKAFGSWKEMGESYITGFEAWSGEKRNVLGTDAHYRFEIMKELLKDPQSPWTLYDWNMSLEKK
ncbi:MAG TPA: tetratricopeptide repeat protein [Clostridia bacterium]|nr:tetratricopeptide repeat protein [Clostridia bacterium]